MDNVVAVTKFIVEELAPELDPSDLEPDYALLEHGILDSLGLLLVLAWVEDEFGVKVDIEQIEQADFGSVSAICSLIDNASPNGNGIAAGKSSVMP